MHTVQLLVVIKARRPIQLYRLISIHGLTTLLVKPKLYGVGRWTGGGWGVGQAGQWTFNFRVRVTIVAVEKQYYTF
jgi:hypothetical protein